MKRNDRDQGSNLTRAERRKAQPLADHQPPSCRSHIPEPNCPYGGRIVGAPRVWHVVDESSIASDMTLLFSMTRKEEHFSLSNFSF